MHNGVVGINAKKLLKDFIIERKWTYIAGIIILVFTSFIASLIPKIIGIITDGLNGGTVPRQYIFKYVLLMVATAVTVFVLKFIWRYFLIGNCRNVEVYLRDKLFKHLQTLPLSFYNNNKTGDLIAYAINDIQAIRQNFGFGIVAILEGVAVNSISIFFMASTISPVLTVMALAPIPLAVVIMIKLRVIIRQRFTKVQEAFADISDKVQENISGIRVIKAFAQEEEEVESFIKYNQARVDTHMRLTKASALLGPSVQVCFGISFLLFIIFGSGLVVDGTITIGDYIAFNTYMIAIMGPIMNIGRIIEVWQRGMASFKRLENIFNTTTDIVDRESEEKPGTVNGKIEIRSLDFSYPSASRKSLKNINITLHEGATLGILGKTGCGKTTLINLLLRLYRIEDGHIFIDGTDINEIPLELLRERIGYVPQDNFLFSTTIRNNIEFFRQCYTECDVEQAARMSGVYDNILAFPDGFDTVVGERGVTLSGGQKQRISIARALIKKPSILILDDSLSAVDTKTEEEILGNIKQVLQDRTGILISHRVSTVRHADEILFMDKGEIIERGTHEELMKLKGQYYKLYQIQTSSDSNSDSVSNPGLREAAV